MGKSNVQPIGVFDSGLGGLTVVKELMRQLPFEDVVYFGDTARVPYGTKSKDAIIRFSVDNTKILLKEKVKCIVVACNSSSSYALPTLRKKFNLPILGVIEPGAQKSAETTQTKRIGVIATQATVQSGKYDRAIKKINKQIQVFSQACPLFVPLVEEGWIDKKITNDVIREYLTPLIKKRIDTLVLGCTHYPLLKNSIKKNVGNKITLVDSATQVVLQVQKLLMEKGLVKSKTTQKGKLRFLISDKPQAFKQQAKSFLGHEIRHVQKVTHI